jgi:hypothetical protein
VPNIQARTTLVRKQLALSDGEWLLLIGQHMDSLAAVEQHIDQTDTCHTRQFVLNLTGDFQDSFCWLALYHHWVALIEAIFQASMVGGIYPTVQRYF